jgi:predicted ATPase
MERRKNNAGVLVVRWLLILQAGAQNWTGRIDLVLHSVDEAMGWVEQYGERWQLAEILRCKGDLAARVEGSESTDQGDWSRKALEVSHGQASLAFELRAATSLAHRWADPGNCKDAHGLLTPICKRFAEGFQTNDLEGARTLLSTLSVGQQGGV